MLSRSIPSPQPRRACYAFADPFGPAAIAAGKARDALPASSAPTTAPKAAEPASDARSPVAALFDAASPDTMPAPVALHSDAVEPLPAVEPAIPSYGRFRLVDLPARGCRWPMASDEAGSHLFCGETRLAGRSYCPEHFKVSRRAATAPRVMTEAEKARRAEIGRRNLATRRAVAEAA